MTNTPSQDDALILDSLERFLARDVKPYVRELEHDDVYPAEIVEQMKALGLFGATIPEEYDGLGLSYPPQKKSPIPGWRLGVIIRQFRGPDLLDVWGRFRQAQPTQTVG